MNDSEERVVSGGDDAQHGHQHVGGSVAKLVVGSIGIVFGDIGTSPIYAFRETFAGHHPLAPDPLHIYGVLSLIFWSMMIVVTIKYVSIIMRADNKGEGGSLALLALINQKTEGAKWTAPFIMLGVFATALFYGDSMITPAMSVLSAAEGLQPVKPDSGPGAFPFRAASLGGFSLCRAGGQGGVGCFFAFLL